MRTFPSDPRRGGSRSRVRAHDRLPARLLILIAAAAATLLLATSVRALDITLQVNTAPPALPVYDQPPIPAEGYLWVPGYWAYGQDGWFWVPGTWVEPPSPGLVWTPGYWGWQDGMYVWNAGYWAPQVGFYGGIDYGYGYSGNGYDGGYWQGDRFYYNRAVTNITNVNVTNVYTKNVSNTTTVNTVSYNGGNGGATARPTAQQEATAHQHHQGPTAPQEQQVSAARSNHEQLASVNHGRPPIAATPKPGALSGAGTEKARSGGEPPNAGAPHPGAGAQPEKAPAERNEQPPANESPLRLSEAQRAQEQSRQHQPAPPAAPPAQEGRERPAPPAPETREGRTPPAAPPQEGRPQESREGRAAPPEGHAPPATHAPPAGPAEHGNARPDQRPQREGEKQGGKPAEPERKKPDEGRPQP